MTGSGIIRRSREQRGGVAAAPTTRPWAECKTRRTPAVHVTKTEGQNGRSRCGPSTKMESGAFSANYKNI
jgi:hypothetical protein